MSVDRQSITTEPRPWTSVILEPTTSLIHPGLSIAVPITKLTIPISWRVS